jgi:hypothetical protein
MVGCTEAPLVLLLLLLLPLPLLLLLLLLVLHSVVGGVVARTFITLTPTL